MLSSWGIKNDIDYIAASFTRKASDVTEIRQYTDELMKEFYGENHGRPLPKIIAKIENTEALDNFDSILEETDGIMVARGDLGVEIPMEKLAFVQKEIVRKSIMAGLCFLSFCRFIISFDQCFSMSHVF